MSVKYKLLISYVLFVSIAAGCAGVKKQPTLPRAGTSHQVKVIPKPALVSKQLRNIEDNEMQDYVQKQGVVFGKTDFQGVLKTIYVKLLFEHVTDPDKRFQLYIGDSSSQDESLFDVKTVSPGYFFIELPQGRYKISSVSIPVGSTLATEDIDVEFDVLPDSITYMGTLKIDGTKERIKLGGVPVIKPGFEYTLEILDEQKDGISMFRQKYPTVNKNIEVHLMARPQIPTSP